jgi:hypothetical protein
MQAALFTWFGNDGPTPLLDAIKKEIMMANKGAISESNAGNQDSTQHLNTASPKPGAAKVTTYPGYVTHDAVLQFLLTVYPCGHSETLPSPGQKLLENPPERLIEQFYFIGPVGERFFHWFFILGGADKQIIWDKKTKETTVKSLEAWQLKNKVVIDDVPFWRAMALVRDSLIKHLSSKTKPADSVKTGLYFAGENKRNDDCDIPEGSASEIFTVEEIYTHAKDTFAQGFKNFPPLSSTATTGSATSVTDAATREAQIFEQNIRGQLEFEWLITRPYSPCWMRKKKEDQEPNADTDQTKSQGNEEATNASIFSSAARNKTRRSSVLDGEILPKTPVTFNRISDESLGRNSNNVFWDWNESMWQSAVKAVNDVNGKNASPQHLQQTAGKQCDTIFYERTVDYQLNFMGENLFHL